MVPPHLWHYVTSTNAHLTQIHAREQEAAGTPADLSVLDGLVFRLKVFLAERDGGGLVSCGENAVMQGAVGGWFSAATRSLAVL